MAVVEWRGRFAAKEVKPRAADLGTISEVIPRAIKAIGNLRVAAISLVVGAVLMLGAAWIAQSAAHDSQSDATTTTTDTTAPETTTTTPGGG
jgi:hypothetical protein